jgi:hypothetical protein
MGAADTRRSIIAAFSSEERPIFPVLSMLRVSAVFLRVTGNLWVAEAT